jgi:uncharacterized protein involved in outer membrane biogenesis
MKKLILKLAIGLAALLVVGLIAAALFLGSIVRKGVETVGPKLTGTSVTLAGANLSLLSGSGGLKGFVVGNPPGYPGDFAIKVGEVVLGVAPASLFSDKIHIRQIRLVSPEIRVEGDLRKNNLLAIRDHVKSALNSGDARPATPAAGGKPGAEKKLQVDEFTVTGAIVFLRSDLIGPKELQFTLPDIHLAQLGQGPDGITGAELADRLLAELNGAVTTAAAKRLAEQASKAAGDALKGVTDKAAKGLGDLLKKK